MSGPTVFKAGGSAGVDRDRVADLVASAAAAGAVVLVHGASAETDRLSVLLGHPPETVLSPSGHQSRRTDRRTLEVFALAALGIENFQYVEKLQARDVDAIGLSGLSARLLVGRRKLVRALRDGRTVVLRDDHTGTVDRVNSEFLHECLAARRVPVIAPLALSEEGAALNVDGDRVAARVAAALCAERLVILTNVPGLLEDVSDLGTVVSRASLAEAETLATGRMRKKVLAAREALEAGVNDVVVRGLDGPGTLIRP
jgi:acetylglutamate/LysW-gamma-L-alpha-aminoadipate kinase